MPQIIRFMLLHGAVGFGLAAVFVALLVSTDTGGLGTLLHGAESQPMPALLLWAFCGLTFGSVQIGAAVMLLGEENNAPHSGTRVPVAIPVWVRRH